MSHNKIEQRAAKIGLVNGISTLLSIAFQLLSVPICLKYWGKDTYGSWLTLYASFMLIRSLNTGYGNYVGNKINVLYHQDQQALREHMASSIIGIAIISAIQLSIGMSAIFTDQIMLLLGMNASSVNNLDSGIALLILTVTWALSGSYIGIIHRLLIPTGLMYQAAWWGMGLQASQFLGIMLAAILHFDLLQTSLLFAFIQFTVYIASAIYIRIKLPAYYPWWKKGSLRTGIKDLRNSVLLTISDIIRQGISNGTIILVSYFSGSASVPIFTTVRTLANLWTTVSTLLSTPLFPEIVRFYATGELQKLVTTNRVYWIIAGTIVNLGVLISYPLIEPIYMHWTAHAVTFDKSLVCMLLASVVTANAGSLIVLYFQGINALGIIFSTSIIRGISSLAAGTGLYFYFGLAGFGMGALIGEFFALILMVLYFKLLLFKKNTHIPTLSLLNMTISTGSVILFFINESFNASYSNYVYSAALLAVIFSAIWGWILLEINIRRRLIDLIFRRFIKKMQAL